MQSPTSVQASHRFIAASRLTACLPPVCTGKEEAGGSNPSSKFLDQMHDLFISRLHDVFCELYGIEITNIRIEDFRILNPVRRCWPRGLSALNWRGRRCLAGAGQEHRRAGHPDGQDADQPDQSGWAEPHRDPDAGLQLWCSVYAMLSSASLLMCVRSQERQSTVQKLVADTDAYKVEVANKAKNNALINDAKSEVAFAAGPVCCLPRH